jgi:hypothetical protein
MIPTHPLRTVIMHLLEAFAVDDSTEAAREKAP